MKCNPCRRSRLERNRHTVLCERALYKIQINIFTSKPYRSRSFTDKFWSDEDALDYWSVPGRYELTTQGALRYLSVCSAVYGAKPVNRKQQQQARRKQWQIAICPVFLSTALEKHDQMHKPNVFPSENIKTIKRSSLSTAMISNERRLL